MLKSTLINIVKDCFAIILITCVLLLLIEVALRIVYPDKKAQISPYEYDPYCLWKIKKSIVSTYKMSRYNGNRSITWKSNRDGFRGLELSSDAEFRIMIYGDSNIHARFVKLDQTLAMVLQRLLSQKTRKRIEVINAGVIGYGPDQYLLKMQQELERYKPDLVLVNFFADNDLGDPLRNRLLYLESQGNLQLTAFDRSGLNDPEAVPVTDRFVLLKALAKVRNILLKKNHGQGGAILKSYFELSKKEYNTYLLGGPRVQAEVETHYDLDVALTPNSKSARLKVRLTIAIIGEMRELCETLRTPLVAIIEPSTVDICKNYKLNYTHLTHYPGYARDNLSNVFLSILKEKELPAINLFPVFASYKPERLYFHVDDNHWNENGQQLAAEYIGEFLLENEFL